MCGGVWNGFLLDQAKKEEFLVGFVARGMVMVIYFGSALSPPLPCCMLGSFLSFPHSWPLIVEIGLVACCGMAVSLGSVVLVRGTLGRPLLAIWLAVSLRVVQVLIPATLLLFGFRQICWDADDIALEMSEVLNIWTDGRRKDFSLIGGSELAGAGV